MSIPPFDLVSVPSFDDYEEAFKSEYINPDVLAGTLDLIMCAYNDKDAADLLKSLGGLWFLKRNEILKDA